MRNYLSCLKKTHNINEMECRLVAKAYLKCRMDQSVFPIPTHLPVRSHWATRSGLMVPDEFKNLGFQDGGGQAGAKEKGNETRSGNRLEELRRENAELLKKHATEKKQ